MAKAKGSKVKQLIYLAIAFAFLIYGIYQLFCFFSKQYETERVISYVGEDSVKSEGFFFKNEIVLNSSISSNADYDVSEGEKVAKDQKISALYEGQLNISLQNRIRDIEEKIIQLESGISGTDLFATDIMKLDSMISKKISEILNTDSAGNFKATLNETNELQILINKKSAVNGNASLIENEIKKLKGELNSLKANSNQTLSEVKAPASGYFSSVYDGYENLLRLSESNKLTVSEFSDFLNFTPDTDTPKGYIGKIITDFDWTFACIVNASEIDELDVGNIIYLKLPRVSDESCKATVKYISDIENNQRVLMISGYLYMDIINNLRKEDCEIILKKYSGYKVNKNAVRIVDGQTGIYVLSGIVIKFKPVDVKLNKDDYAIVTSKGKPEILPTDDVIISGKDIYDGKIIE